MTKWRNRVGAERLEALLKETIALAVREKHLPKRDLARITVDTTVQEKNITYPTDSKLLYKAIVKLGHAVKSHGIPLRQSYVRVGKKAAVMAGRYAHAKQYKRMRRSLRKLRTYVGRMIRDIQRKATGMDEELVTLLDRADRVRTQQPKDKNKLYRRRRSAIEPKIGHLKIDHRMGRCFLARLCGDAINAVPAAAGANLRKLLGLLREGAGRFVCALRESPKQTALTLVGWAKASIRDRRFHRNNYLAAA